MEKIKASDRPKLLIVDDSPDIINALGGLLPDHYKRQVALDGEKALKLLATTEELPDLILLDVMMPGMTGYEVCSRLKEDERLKGIPVIFLSALTDTENKVKAFSEGGVDYITKPFQYEEVLARVKTHLKLYFLQQEIENHRNNLELLVKEQVNEISEAQMATIYALAKLAESRDQNTGMHLERTQLYCYYLVKKLGESPKYQAIIDDELCNNIYMAAPLHDVGKVGVSDNILLKPGKLTPEEFEAIKLHTVIGAQTLQEVQEKYSGNVFINIGIDIVRSHHEKWDGSGYPDGLAGEDIPLSARIMALADVYDALRTRRPYKEPFSHAKSREIILEGSGKHFDPSVMEAFLSLEDKFEDISSSYSA